MHLFLWQFPQINSKAIPTNITCFENYIKIKLLQLFLQQSIVKIYLDMFIHDIKRFLKLLKTMSRKFHPYYLQKILVMQSTLEINRKPLQTATNLTYLNYIYRIRRRQWKLSKALCNISKAIIIFNKEICMLLRSC